jgi:hypothetical protein
MEKGKEKEKEKEKESDVYFDPLAILFTMYSGVTPKLSPCAIPRIVPTLLPTLTPFRVLGNCYLYMKF